MKTKDTIQKFTFEHANIRGEIAHLEEAYQKIISQRPYPEKVKELLGEALVSCLLVTSTLKFEGEVSLQFNGDERLPLLIVQCNHKQEIRAFAKYKEDAQNSDFENAFLNGKMALVINQYKNNHNYQSLVPINSLLMSENLMHYFAQSEQISTKIWLAVSENSVSGMLLQLLPGSDTEEQENFWEYAVKIGETITKDELLSLDNQTLLHRLYHETVIRLYNAKAVEFKCRCNKEKMQEVIKILGKEDITKLLEERDTIDVSCDFCNENYSFDSIDIAMLFKYL